jgi:ADP-heptose:LPS heptosyltransferase
VFSSHLLQCLINPEKALKEWWRVIKPGGYLVLYLPHKDLYPNVKTEGAHMLHRHDFLPEDIDRMLEASWDGISGRTIAMSEVRDQDDEYSFLQIYYKGQPNRDKLSTFPFGENKTAMVIRYGGIGDSIQTSSILPQLKEQGYHVTFLTQSDGYEVLKHDPHIDSFYLVDRGQVPMEELRQFWLALEKKYDRLINLTESVEVGMLLVPGMTAHKWPKSVREKRFNENYLQFTHEIAELPYKPNPRFYSTKKEREWARKWLKKKKADPIIMWCVGSSLHKAYPYMDQIIARILVTYKDAKILLVGDELDRLLDTGWENEPRVIKKAGKWSIRETLTMTEMMDLIIGTETGVMNAVSHTPVPKVLNLSHSTENNLSRDWLNCITLTPQGCDCYPCHQLNSSFRDCPRHEETGTAMCQALIDPDQVWEAICKYIG